MKEQYYVALDVGSSSVKVVVGEKFHDGVNIIGTGQTFTDGVSKGMIRDFDLAKSGIIDTVKKAELLSNINIDEVFLKVPITNSDIIFESETLRFSGEDTEIDGELIEELLENIRFKEISNDREVVTVFPVSFLVDNLHEVEDPKGIIARESLTVRAGLIAVDRTLFLNMGNCAAEAGLNIIDVTSDAYNYTHILTESEIELGAVVIDVGADLTQYAFYEEGALSYAGIVQMGGNTVTETLAEEFNTNFHYANRAKEQYGHAFFEHASDSETIVLPQNNKNEDIEVTAKDLADVIEITMEDIFLTIFEDLAKVGIDKISGGFILTGGTANMRGVRDLMLDIVAENVRIHIPTQMGARKPEYASAIATIESGIHFDELLEYVTIDNHETAVDETGEAIEESDKDSFFPSLFKERKTKNREEQGYTNENKVSQDTELESEIEPLHETDLPENDDESELVDDTDDDREQPAKKEKSDFSGFMKKVFKNLFE